MKNLRMASHLLVALYCLLLLICMGTPAWAAVYYVDATYGNDTNSGLSPDTAWKTVAKVSNTAFEPGDQILFKRGETWHEGLWFKWSGAPDSPIVIGAYGDLSDPKPVFDGTYPMTVTWENVSGNIYRTTAPAWNNFPGILVYNNIPAPSIYTIECASALDDIRPGAVLVQVAGGYANFYVTAVNYQDRKLYGITFFTNTDEDNPDRYWLPNSNIEVRQLDSTTGEETSSTITISENGGLHVEPASLTAPGQWYWDSTEKAIYLYAASEADTHDVKIGFVSWGFVMNTKEYITLQDIAFNCFKEVGIYLAICNHINIRNVSVYGVGASGHKTGILLHETNHSTVENSRVEYAMRTGISIYAVQPTENIAGFNTISGNEILNSGSAGISMSTDTVTRQVAVQNNTIINNRIDGSNRISYDAAGIYLLNVGIGNRLVGNTISNGGSAQLRSAGIMVDSDVLPVVIEDNTIENNSLGGISVTGSSHEIKNNIIRNNGVPSWASAQMLFFTVKENASNCTVTGNSMEAQEDQSLFMVLNGKPTTSDLPHTIDHNVYVSANPSPFCWVNQYTCSGDSLMDFPHWKCAPGTLIDGNSTYNGEQPQEEPPECKEVVEPPPEYRDPLTFYISSSTGDDSNDGLSESTPWKTAWKLAPKELLVPGDVVLFKRGDTWHEKLWLNSSGSESAPIVIGAYGDESDPPPLFDGTTLHEVVWEQLGGFQHIYRTTAPSWTKDPGMVIIDDKVYPSIATLHFTADSPLERVKPGAALIQRTPYYANFHVTSVDVANHAISGTTFFRTATQHWLANATIEVRQVDNEGNEEIFNIKIDATGGISVVPSSLTATGHWYWDSADGSIYLYSEQDPATLSLKIGELQEGVYMMNMRYVTFRDFDVTGFTDSGIHFFFCKGITVENINVSAIGANGHSSAILLHNTDHSTVKNCRIESVLVNGIGLFALSPDFEVYNTNYNIIENNVITDVGSAGISLNTSFPQQAINVSYNTIRYNTIEKANSISYDAAGVYMLMAGVENEVRGNTIRNCGTATLRSAGVMVDTDVGPTIIRDNLIENNAWYGIAVTGSGHEIINNTVQYNALLPGDRAQIVFFSAKGKNATNCTVKENTIRGTAEQIMFIILNNYDPTNDAPNFIDLNRYEIYSDTDIDETHPAFCWRVGATCDHLIDFATWQTVSCDSGIPCRDEDSTLVLNRPYSPDYDGDGDVDGMDLAALASGLNPDVSIEEFAAIFGSQIQ